MHIQKQHRPNSKKATMSENADNIQSSRSPKTVQHSFGNSRVIQKADESSQTNLTPTNKTGMPDRLKSGLENLSGYDLSQVKVHYNSPKPKQIGALAYTQGTDVHVGPGQQKHLPHEGWHVVQQMQGRVKPTLQTKGISINDDAGLETEADVMSTMALSKGQESNTSVNKRMIQQKSAKKEVLQRKISILKLMEAQYWSRDADEQTGYVTPNDDAEIDLIKRAAERPSSEWPLLEYNEKHAHRNVTIRRIDEQGNEIESTSLFAEEGEDEGIVMDPEMWTKLDTSAPQNGKWIYVVAPTGQIYLGKESKNYHSEALAGKEVGGAGEITIVNNIVTELNKQSGHYKPDESMLKQTRDHMLELDVKFSEG